MGKKEFPQTNLRLSKQERENLKAISEGNGKTMTRQVAQWIQDASEKQNNQ